MKTKIILIVSLTMMWALPSRAQFTVVDPVNIATSITNSIQEIVQTSSTAMTMLNNFKETIKIFEQGKKYYDGLKSVTGLVKDGIKVRKTILMVGDISEIYIVNFERMLQDDHYTVDELGAIAVGYAKLLAESADMLMELKDVVNITTLSMSDKERMDVIDRVYKSVLEYRNLVYYYTNKNIMVSFLRAKSANDAARIRALYGLEQKYW